MASKLVAEGSFSRHGSLQEHAHVCKEAGNHGLPEAAWPVLLKQGLHLWEVGCQFAS